MPQLVELKPLPGYKLWLRYVDGVEGTVDLAPLVGKGVFVEWKDPDVFGRVRLAEYGAPVWGESIDLCPDSLYLQLTGQAPEDIFPSLKPAASDA